jgi:putative flippase GtrA
MRWRHWHLLATPLAVESAIVHNFLWHQSFTWRDRHDHCGSGWLKRFLRFHLSNGLVSLVGNLLFMRLLVGALRVPVIAANVLAIALCFMANFIASDRWVFLSEGSSLVSSQRLVNVPRLALSGPASILACAPRRERTAEPRLPLARVQGRSGEQAGTATAPIIRPRRKWVEICAEIFG